MIFPLSLFAAQQGEFKTYQDIRLFGSGIGSPVFSQPSHPEAVEQRALFYPPHRGPLYIRMPRTEAADIRLTLDGEIRELHLPSAGEGALLELAPGETGAVTELIMPAGLSLYTEKPREGELRFRMDPEHPENLYLIPESVTGDEAADGSVDDTVVGAAAEGGAEETESELILELKNIGLLKISGDGRIRGELRPHKLSRTFRFPTGVGEEPWMLSPAASLKSIDIREELIPEFPVPLEREGYQILQADPETWRNRDFEIYSWSSFPNVLVFDCRDYDIQNRFFRRLAFFVEKKGFRGELLSNEELEGRHGWNANDYRSSDLAEFFNKARETAHPLYEEEIILRDTLVREGILTADDLGLLKGGDGAVISMALESGEALRYRFFTHEASHGIYFTHKEYRDFIARVWNEMEAADRELWRFFLGWYGYDPEDEDLMINEFQAYSIQQPIDGAEGYFVPRMTRLANSYPAHRSLLERGMGEKSERFRIWAERINAFLRDNWGLEAGNFSPLQKESP